MAMTLRLDDDRTQRLREQAEREGRSMHDVVIAALDDRFERAETRRHEIGERMLARYSGAFERLADL